MLWANVRRHRAGRVMSVAMALILVTALASPGVAVFADETPAAPLEETVLAPATPEPDPVVEEEPAQVPVETEDKKAFTEAPVPDKESVPDVAADEPAEVHVESGAKKDTSESVEIAPVTVPVIALPLQVEDESKIQAANGPRDDFPAPIVVGEGCELTTIATFWAGQHTNAGSVSATQDAENLYVTFATTGGWTMGLTHLYVGLVPPASYAPGSFPYQTTHNPAVTTFTYTIPLVDIDAVPGDTVYIAAHAEVSNGQQNETAWAGVGQWPGLMFTHTIQECDEPEEDVTKSFSLTFEDPPAGAEFYASFSLEGSGTVTVPLTGEGPYIGEVDLPHGSTITVSWWIVLGGEHILLGTGEEETLLQDELNEFDYVATASGYKFDDADADGIWDDGEDGMAGWTIYLYRLVEGEGGVEEILYAVTTTGDGGAYSFSGLVPGSYRVVEEDREGWIMTVGPEDPFDISNDSAVTGLIFGNSEEPFEPFTAPDLAIVKVASVSSASPGQTVVYTLTFRNIGDGAASNYLIVDDYDERYLDIIDSAGGIVADGKITWMMPGPLAASDGPQTISYTARVKTTMPIGETDIDNVVVISHPDDENLSNNTDDATVKVNNPFMPFTEEETKKVDVDEKAEEFLPFTGGESMMLAMAALFAALAGATLRLAVRKA